MGQMISPVKSLKTLVRTITARVPELSKDDLARIERALMTAETISGTEIRDLAQRLERSRRVSSRASESARFSLPNASATAWLGSARRWRRR
jgi:hypothetical protein